MPAAVFFDARFRAAASLTWRGISISFTSIAIPFGGLLGVGLATGSATAVTTATL